MASNIVRFDQVRGIAFADILATYLPVGFNYASSHPPTPAPFTHAMRVLHFINNTNGDMMVSFDGVTDNVPVLAEGFALYDLTSDEDTNESFRYQNGTQIYVRYLSAPTAPVDGAFYVVAIYGKGE